MEYSKSIACVGGLNALVLFNSFSKQSLRCITIQMKTKWKFIFMWIVQYTVFIRLNTALDQTSQMHGSKITNNQLINESQFDKVKRFNLNFRALRYPTTCPAIERRSVTSRYHGNTISGWQKNQRRQQRQGERQKIICLHQQTKISHVNHAVLYISLPSLHHYDMKLPNFVSPLYGVGKHNHKIVAFFF